MKITIECNDEQANLMVAALEEYFRTRMGQTDFLSNNLAFDDFNYESHTEEEFNKAIENREDLENILRQIKIYLPRNYSSDKCRSASDIWSCLRHELYLHNGGDINNYTDVRASKPIQMGVYDLPEIDIAK